MTLRSLKFRSESSTVTYRWGAGGTSCDQRSQKKALLRDVDRHEVVHVLTEILSRDMMVANERAHVQERLGRDVILFCEQFEHALAFDAHDYGAADDELYTIRDMAWSVRPVAVYCAAQTSLSSVHFDRNFQTGRFGFAGFVIR